MARTCFTLTWQFLLASSASAAAPEADRRQPPACAVDGWRSLNDILRRYL